MLRIVKSNILSHFCGRKLCMMTLVLIENQMTLKHIIWKVQKP